MSGRNAQLAQVIKSSEPEGTRDLMQGVHAAAGLHQLTPVSRDINTCCRQCSWTAVRSCHLNMQRRRATLRLT